MTPSNQRIVSRLKKSSIVSLIKKGLRVDGRKLNEYREITIIPNYISKAEGSAYAKIGGTLVIAGLKVGIGTPYPDTPNCGVITVNAEFVPFASPTFEPGPPDENAIELARVIDRSIRELKVIDLEKLAIIPGEKVYILWLDIYVFDHDGNLLDTSMLAAITTLLTARIPKAVIREDGKTVELDKEVREPLPITNKVVTVSIGKVNGKFIVDPNIDEEQVLDCRLAISVSEDGKIAGMQKMGSGTFTVDEVIEAVKIAKEASRTLFDKINEALKNIKK
ncbi:MAG: hypothetical protein DRO08_02335 [Thermoprotei archaeon]|nr:MAG: hypothetical protein DRO08_02335 [Thermoprotei archaeon]